MSARNSRILQICMIGKHNILKFNIISLICKFLTSCLNIMRQDFIHTFALDICGDDCSKILQRDLQRII